MRIHPDDRKIPYRIMGLLASYNYDGTLSSTKSQLLKDLWALLDCDEREELTEWCIENYGKMPPLINDVK
jgi:hypothetical protein